MKNIILLSGPDKTKYFSKEISKEIKEKVNCKVIALGGINELNFKEVLGAGADDFACMSLLFMSNNIKKSLDTFKSL